MLVDIVGFGVAEVSVACGTVLVDRTGGTSG